MKLENMTKTSKYVIKQLYKQAFPKEERRSFFIMNQKYKKGIMEILSIQSEGETVGLVISSCHEEFVLLEYFAVVDTKRGSGLGSKALELIKDRYKGKTLMLEIEEPKEDVNDIKMRRQNFYNRHGFFDAGIQVLFYGVPMKVLSYEGKQISSKDYENHYRKTAGISSKWYVKVVSSLS